MYLKGRWHKESLNITRESYLSCTIPANTSHLFQPLESSVNGLAKVFMNKLYRIVQFRYN